MKKGSDKDANRIKASQKAAKQGMYKRTTNKKNDNTKLYYTVIGVFVALCGYIVVEVFLNPKKSLSQTPAIDQNKVSIHNSKTSYHYKQGLIDFWSDKTLADAKSMFQGGFSSSPQIQQCMVDNQSTASIPQQFNAHENWPNCVSEIRNQGKCASGPELQVASAMSQRRCIHQNGDFKELSAQAILACSQFKPDKKCQESYANQAFYHMMDKGVSYEEDCPYDPTSIQCTDKCKESKFKAYDMCLLTNFDSIRREIMNNGPVVGFILPTIDFLPYESGFYHQVDGQSFKGQHILKIIGWTGSNMKEDSWIVQNTWGKGWGEEGKARIQMAHLPVYAIKASVEQITTDIQSQKKSQTGEEEINIDSIQDQEAQQLKPEDDKAKDQKTKDQKTKDDQDKNQKPEDDKAKDQKTKNDQDKNQKPEDDKAKDQMTKNDQAKDQKTKDDEPKNQKPKNDKAKDQKPTDQKPKDQKPKDDKPENQKPKDDKPENQKPKDDKPENQKPKNDKPKNQKTKDDKPKDQNPKDDKPKNQKPKNDKAKDQKPKDQKTKDDQAKNQSDKTQEQKQNDDKNKKDQQPDEKAKDQKTKENKNKKQKDSRNKKKSSNKSGQKEGKQQASTSEK